VVPVAVRARRRMRSGRRRKPSGLRLQRRLNLRQQLRSLLNCIRRRSSAIPHTAERHAGQRALHSQRRDCDAQSTHPSSPPISAIYSWIIVLVTWLSPREALVLADMVVMRHEGGKLAFEIAGWVIGLKQDAVLERLTPALDLASGPWAISGAADISISWRSSHCARFVATYDQLNGDGAAACGHLNYIRTGGDNGAPLEGREIQSGAGGVLFVIERPDKWKRRQASAGWRPFQKAVGNLTERSAVKMQSVDSKARPLSKSHRAGRRRGLWQRERPAHHRRSPPQARRAHVATPHNARSSAWRSPPRRY
jgi:hypothetical protein